MEVGLNEPQALAGVQLQVTPAASFVVAAIAAVLLGPAVDNVAGGGVDIVTVMPLLMVTVAWASFVVSVTEVALIVTEPPEGMVAGEL